MQGNSPTGALSVRWQPVSLPCRVAHAGTRVGHSPSLSLCTSPASALASAWVALPVRPAMNLGSSHLLPRAAMSGAGCNQAQGSCYPSLACLVPESASTLARGIPKPVPQILEAAHTRSSLPDIHFQLRPEGPRLQALGQSPLLWLPVFPLHQLRPLQLTLSAPLC